MTGPHRSSLSTPVLSPVLLILLLVVVLAVDAFGPPLVPQGAFQAWVSLLVGVTVQALPFLVLGVALSAGLTVFVPEAALLRYLPRRKAVAVPVVAVSGMALPACECASVPVANSLLRKGLPPAAALAFMLASPAINPVVLVSTAVAFTGQPAMVWARFISSLAVACLVGWLWRGSLRASRSGDHDHAHHGAGASRADAFRAAVIHDFLNSAGFLAIGAAIAVTLKVFIPPAALQVLADNWWMAILVMAALAVIMALCSEADAFIAASFTFVSPTAQLVFMVVGPVVDTKLIAMQYGAWGRRFVERFVPIVLVVAVGVATAVGWLVFGLTPRT